MFLKKLQIVNFKSFQDVTIDFNKSINILTGVNNAGKTTMLEAVSLWHECFSKLIQEAKKGTTNYKKGDFVLGNTQNKYFPSNQINSVRSPHINDIFYRCDKKNHINLNATFDNDSEEMGINFKISESGLNYVIELMGNTSYDYQKFNSFFKQLPSPIGLYYASPVSAIKQQELFVTKPQIQDAILNRESASVFRNRLYLLYRDTSYSFSRFMEDLSFILFGGQQSITITTDSDFNRDTSLLFNFKIGQHDVEKEIALLGSGSLQIMEILLNLYYPGDSNNKDMNLVLLDEPDSHIHRDIQQRLLTTLNNFSRNTQVILSTHNEALIRNAPLSYLFHLESKPVNHYKNLAWQDADKQGTRFKGIYPSVTNPVISALGHSNGLDFINAIEADCLLFVEGEDDARAFEILLKNAVINNPKRYVYWVLGGVSHVFTQLPHYETVFSAIKNDKTLWAKSALIFDRDYLDDKLRTDINERLKQKLTTFIWSAYTFEATLLTDLNKTALLLGAWLNTKNQQVNSDDLYVALKLGYEAQSASLENAYTNEFYEGASHEQQEILKKVNAIFAQHQIKLNPQQINTRVREHVQNCLVQKHFYKLMKKEHVGKILDDVVTPYGVSFDVETDFIQLMQCVKRASCWLDEWDIFTQL